MLLCAVLQNFHPPACDVDFGAIGRQALTDHQANALLATSASGKFEVQQVLLPFRRQSPALLALSLRRDHSLGSHLYQLSAPSLLSFEADCQLSFVMILIRIAWLASACLPSAGQALDTECAGRIKSFSTLQGERLNGMFGPDEPARVCTRSHVYCLHLNGSFSLNKQPPRTNGAQT